MIDIAPFISRFKTVPMTHQIRGVQELVNHHYFALFDEQGVGKTKQAIDAVSVLHELNLIKLVIVLTPASVRQSWIDPEFGEVRKHCFTERYVIYEYHAKGLVKIFETSKEKPRLAFLVTNYEYLLKPSTLKELSDFARKNKTTLICDESSFIKSPKAKRTKAALKLREMCDRVYLLNGTPMSNNALDLFPQAKIMHPSILGIRTKTEFVSRYCRLGGVTGRIIIGHQNLEELQQKMKPHVLRRKKVDCFDLPDKLYKIARVPLSARAWQVYKEMRDEAITLLPTGEVSMAPLAITKVARLTQITSGFLGGVHEMDPSGEILPDTKVIILGSEKADYIKKMVDDALEADPKYRVLIWSRYRVSREMIAERLKGLLPVYQIYGGQHKTEREQAIREFSTVVDKPAACIGQQQSGGFGLNFITCFNVIYESNTYSLIDRLQSEDRTHRYGQKNQVLYTDLAACGPNGQLTHDAHVSAALQAKHDVAEWTTGYWREILGGLHPLKLVL
jgi:SNF2 family DNA or RNA helicase